MLMRRPGKTFNASAQEASGTGGTHIIDEEEVLARQVYRATQRKEVCHVLLSLVSLESGLTLTEAFSAQHFRVDRQSCHLMETLSQPLTLVIAPLSLTLRSEWYRDNHVHPVEKTCHAHLLRHHTSYVHPDVRTVPVFQVVDKTSNLRVWFIEKERSGTAHRRSQSPEQLRHGVVVR